MKALRFVKTVLIRACVIDAVYLNLFYFIGGLISPTLLPYPSAVAWMLVQSLFLSLSLSFLFSDLLTAPLRLVLHFLATCAFFRLTFSLPGGYFKTGVQASSGGVSFLVFFVFFTLIYAVAASLFVLVRHLTGTAEGRAESGADKPGAEYKSQFSPDRGGGRGKGRS